MLAQKSALFSPECRLCLLGSGDHTDKKTKTEKVLTIFLLNIHAGIASYFQDLRQFCYL
jgi:hypothetical protein